MEEICPLCNALEFVEAECPLCGNLLTDGGPVENYYGPYSPYMDVASLQFMLPDRQCVHILFCPQCGYRSREARELMIV